MKQSEAQYKALAYFMFREIIEDAHAKYKISNEDMKEMCKKAVNRAKVYIDSQKSPEQSQRDAFLIYVLYATDWENAEITEDVQTQYEVLESCKQLLRSVWSKE